MSIKDNVNEISENNVAIAENQQKVYEAGVRAGLAQDPDYAEGYDDGYEQGLTDSSGVVWEELLNGKTPVGRAREADHATTATSATAATNADHSLESDHATVASSADDLNIVLPIEKGGTGAATADEALVTLGITTYQKPWDLNENVGPIFSNAIKHTSATITSITDETGKKSTGIAAQITMINSGEVCLHYTADIFRGSSTSISNTYIAHKVLKNDEVVSTIKAYCADGSGALASLNGMFSVKLNVSKGDIITLAVESFMHRDSSPLIPASDPFTNIYLSANIDTPYKYMIFTDIS